MEQNKKTKGFLIGSIVSLVFAGLSLFSVGMMVFMLFFAGTGGTANAVTNEAVLGIAGFMLFAAVSWILGGIALISGIVMLIIGLATKNFKKIWMPIISIVSCLLPALVPIFILLMISAA